MDRLGINLAGAAFLALALSLSNALPWLEGRLNGSFSGLLMNVIALACWAVLTLGLLWRLANRPRKPGSRWMLLRVSLGVVVFVPWLILALQPDATSAFTYGFRRWTASNVKAQAIQEWRANLNLPTATAPAPLWWPTTEREVPLGVAVSRGAFSPALTALGADEVRVVRDPEGVLLAWQGGHAGWVRFVFISDRGSGPPRQLDRHDVDWDLPLAGVYTGVVEHR